LGGCEPADVRNRVIGLLPNFAPHLLLVNAIVTAAWLVCLTLLRRAGWRAGFAVT
jgi:hypothetical protein